MKKSIKKFLIITQVLGWSALLASACTNEKAKNDNSIVTNSSSNTSQKSSDVDKNNQSETKTDSTENHDPTVKHTNSGQQENAMPNQGKKA